MRNLIFVFIGLVVGFAAHDFFVKPQTVIPDTTYEQKYFELKNKFEVIGDADLKEYLELKSEKEKYLKANEIFEKILKIFLIDLGIRSSQAHLDALKTTTTATAPTQPNIKLGIPDKAIVPVRTPKPNADPNGWTKTALKASEVSFESEVKEFLNSVTSNDFNRIVSSSTDLTRQEFNLFRGRYVGEVIFDDSTQPNWNVTMELNGHRDGDAIVGKTLISLSKNGKEFSRSSSNGNNILDSNKSSFQSFPGVKNAMLVNAYAGEAYFQLFYFERLKQFAGIVYSKNKGEPFKRVGIVSLQKS